MLVRWYGVVGSRVRMVCVVLGVGCRLGFGGVFLVVLGGGLWLGVGLACCLFVCWGIVSFLFVFCCVELVVVVFVCFWFLCCFVGLFCLWIEVMGCFGVR